jgi:hypothetical protein
MLTYVTGVVGWSDSEYVKLAGFCEHGDELPVSHKLLVVFLTSWGSVGCAPVNLGTHFVCRLFSCHGACSAIALVLKLQKGTRRGHISTDAPDICRTLQKQFSVVLSDRLWLLPLLFVSIPPLPLPSPSPPPPLPQPARPPVASSNEFSKFTFIWILCVNPCVRALKTVRPLSLGPCRTSMNPQLHKFRFIKLSHRTAFCVAQYKILALWYNCN